MEPNFNTNVFPKQIGNMILNLQGVIIFLKYSLAYKWYSWPHFLLIQAHLVQGTRKKQIWTQGLSHYFHIEPATCAI